MCSQMDLVANGSSVEDEVDESVVSESVVDSASKMDLVNGAQLSNGSTLRIYSKYKSDFSSQLGFDKALVKNQILHAAQVLSKECSNLTLITKDFAVRLKSANARSSCSRLQKHLYFS